MSFLVELFGGEALLRPAMNYRWNFDEYNLDFIKNDFTAGTLPHSVAAEAAAQVVDHASGRIRSAALAFGIVPKSIALVEASYAEFMQLFSDHLQSSPYSVGWAAHSW